MATICALALLSCLLGAVARPSPSTHKGLANGLLDLLRLTSTASLVIALLLGPGLFWRSRRPAGLDLAFMPLPGLALLAATGGLTWILAGAGASAQLVSALVLVPVLILLLAGVVRAPPGEILAPTERRVLAIAGCVLGIATAHALWSLGPSGELDGKTSERTLEVGDRPDSYIPFQVVQLVATGTASTATAGWPTSSRSTSLQGGRWRGLPALRSCCSRAVVHRLAF
jgi:hypothetical protein